MARRSTRDYCRAAAPRFLRIGAENRKSQRANLFDGVWFGGLDRFLLADIIAHSENTFRRYGIT